MAHGSLPLPAPAVLEIARLRGIPLASSAGFPAAELTTPTGLALMACWAQRFGPPPTALPRRVGIGLGSRSLDRPNLLRIILAESVDPAAGAWAGVAAGAEAGAVTNPGDGATGAAAAAPLAVLDAMACKATACDDTACDDTATEDTALLETVLQQQAQIDDATPEDLAFLAEAQRQAGALEVFSQAIAMKKGRHGFLLTALVEPAGAAALRQVWWRHSSTLGVRELLQPRWRLARQTLELATPLGPLRLKRAQVPGAGVRCKPEHDDLVALARRHDLSLAEVRRQVEPAIQAQAMADQAGADPASQNLAVPAPGIGALVIDDQAMENQAMGNPP